MDIIKERVMTLGAYICRTHATVRECARAFGISKSTVHKDMTKRLQYADPAMYVIVRGVLEVNKAERHLRGGEATKQKYQRLKNQSSG